MLFSIRVYGQSEDYTKYQDTVFIKYNKDQTGNTLKYGTDTVIFLSDMRRHILTGTAILNATHNSMGAMEYGIDFKKVTKSDCQQDVTIYGGKIQDKINSIITTDSTLVIDINIYDNCCYDFLCDISVDSSSTLNLVYYGYGTYCSCDCCFGLTYHLTITKGENIPEIKAVSINGNRNTIKQIKNK